MEPKRWKWSAESKQWSGRFHDVLDSGVVYTKRWKLRGGNDVSVAVLSLIH